ncbi:MAG: hypothetical protein UBAL2_80620318, partial [Leptospirillum rubarum]
MDAVDPLFRRTILEPVLRLDHDMLQDPDLLLEAFPDLDQGPSDRWLGPDSRFPETLSDFPPDSCDAPERVLP